MNPQNTSTAGQALGVASLIIGVIALSLAFIPCVGIFALIPGVIAILLSILGFIQANRYNGARSLTIIALIVSFLSVGIALGWGFLIAKTANLDLYETKQIFRDFKDMDVIEDKMDKIESDTNSIEMPVDTFIFKNDSLKNQLK